MEIRDIIHGSIKIYPNELPIIDSKYFQRLRNIKQLGFGELSFPSATHNRYIHSLGALETASRAFDTVFSKKTNAFSQIDLGRFKTLLRLGALLHDCGHGPLSHTSEIAMPPVKDLKLPEEAVIGTKNRKATHEDYTLKMILDSGLTPLIQKALANTGFEPYHLASLIQPEIRFQKMAEAFEVSTKDQKINLRPILQQLISSELDCDRMDYLRRDSVSSGVSYGQFDFDWLLGNLTFFVKDSKCFLALEHRALYALEDFLISRFHMFLMVYFHAKNIIYDEMLARYFLTNNSGYKLPSQIEDYVLCDDSHLHSHLSLDQTPWAKRITQKEPYRMLVELHSGIPATKTAQIEQERLLTRVEKELKTREIDYIRVTSTSELSKYFRKPGFPIYVRYDNHYSQPSFIPLEKCTDLFERYEKNRSITRIYVAPESYGLCRNLGKNQPFEFEDRL